MEKQNDLIKFFYNVFIDNKDIGKTLDARLLNGNECLQQIVRLNMELEDKIRCIYKILFSFGLDNLNQDLVSKSIDEVIKSYIEEQTKGIKECYWTLDIYIEVAKLNLNKNDFEKLETVLFNEIKMRTITERKSNRKFIKKLLDEVPRINISKAVAWAIKYKEADIMFDIASKNEIDEKFKIKLVKGIIDTEDETLIYECLKKFSFFPKNELIEGLIKIKSAQYLYEYTVDIKKEWEEYIRQISLKGGMIPDLYTYCEEITGVSLEKIARAIILSGNSMNCISLLIFNIDYRIYYILKYYAKKNEDLKEVLEEVQKEIENNLIQSMKGSQKGKKELDKNIFSLIYTEEENISDEISRQLIKNSQES